MTGAGDTDFFAANGQGGFTSPADNFGTLMKNADDSYTYVAKGQVSYNFDSAGDMTSVVDTHGLATVYEYDALNRLVEVQAMDGGITLLSYNGSTGQLAGIVEPGNRLGKRGHS
jgi:YD repeat-containing protein